jgi:hypothetical protein
MGDKSYTESPSIIAERTPELVENARDSATDLAEKAAAQAKRDYVEPARKLARKAAEQQKQASADRIGGFARAAHTAADQLENEMPLAAGYVRDAAGGIERMSEAVRNRSVDELLAGVGNFARTQPAAFLGAMVVAGFALSRFLKSTADGGAGPSGESDPHDRV